MRAEAFLGKLLAVSGTSQAATVSPGRFTGRLSRPSHYDCDDRLDIRKTRKRAVHEVNPAGTKLARAASEKRLGLAHKRSAQL